MSVIDVSLSFVVCGSKEKAQEILDFVEAKELGDSVVRAEKFIHKLTLPQPPAVGHTNKYSLGMYSVF